MNLSAFSWWFSSAVPKALTLLSEKIGTAIENRIRSVFLSVRTAHTTETGLQILWEDVHYKPPIPDGLQRVYLQQYNKLLKEAGKDSGTELIDEFFTGTTQIVSHMDLRDHPKLADNYPFQTVRVYITPVGPADYTEISGFLAVVLPARCSKHFQLVNYTEPRGFGRTPFGRCFGKSIYSKSGVVAGFGRTGFGRSFGN